MPNPIDFLGDTGAQVVWTDTTGDHALTLNNLAAGAGRQGATHDFTEAVRCALYTWRLVINWATAPAVGEVVRVYLKTGDGTNWDNDDGEGDIAVSAEDKLKNLRLLGSIVVDEAAAVLMSVGGTIEIREQEIAPVVWNGSAGDNLIASNNVCQFILEEAQDIISDS